ncbi:GntR family transcriptional regulator [Jeotgalibacillus proteolyticus]|uniref:GntR family transcriptional regulator n=1 Tax=Jeotgalibacillus proteolyticus TaxID=2082395 RepID=A0A2S5GBS9_9BACL|nr:GntR family transcriptional regulator [Jeotgalibacillus proteolyticus]PPA70449.1 GntR family transcriptional regulator [Jeotgalibacillus proteolyticus]
MNIPLYEQIYNSILEQIKEGFLKKGDRVLSEIELAEKFNVSRITSKKALDKLAQNNIIERIRGKGSFVAQDHPTVNQADISKPYNTSNSKLIALIVPGFSDSFGSKLVGMIEETCSQNNCNLIIRFTRGDVIEEENAIKSLVDYGVDGLIIHPVHGENYNVELLKLVLENFPLILIDRYLKGIPASSVSTDNQRASECLTNYLFDLGHAEIGFLSSSPDGTSTIEERVKGFNLAYSKRGLILNPSFHINHLISNLPQNHNRESLDKDYAAVKQFILDHPTVTGFNVCEYDLALILLKVIKDLGKNIPEDYSIVCFDSPENLLNRPVFTHIRQNEFDMAKIAVQHLLQLIQGEQIPKHTMVDFTLEEGESTMGLISTQLNEC